MGEFIPASDQQFGLITNYLEALLDVNGAEVFKPSIGEILNPQAESIRQRLAVLKINETFFAGQVDRGMSTIRMAKPLDEAKANYDYEICFGMQSPVRSRLVRLYTDPIIGMHGIVQRFNVSSRMEMLDAIKANDLIQDLRTWGSSVIAITAQPST